MNDLTVNHSTPVYFFPILKAGDIQKCMSDLGFEVSKEELLEPGHHKEKLRKVFMFVVRT